MTVWLTRTTPGPAQSEIIIDHNNVKDLYHQYKAASDKDQRATLVNTSASSPQFCLFSTYELFSMRKADSLVAPKVIREIALHSEAEEVGVYNVLEQKGFAKESKEFRDEHEQLEKVLYSVDWTKMDDPEFGPSEFCDPCAASGPEANSTTDL